MQQRDKNTPSDRCSILIGKRWISTFIKKIIKKIPIMLFNMNYILILTHYRKLTGFIIGINQLPMLLRS